MIEGNDVDTIQGIAEHLVRESGREPTDCWSDALTVWRREYKRDVLALDEDGKVVNLGPVETVFGPE
jgi:hypothetical protein